MFDHSNDVSEHEHVPGNISLSGKKNKKRKRKRNNMEEKKRGDKWSSGEGKKREKIHV